MNSTSSIFFSNRSYVTNVDGSSSCIYSETKIQGIVVNYRSSFGIHAKPHSTSGRIFLMMSFSLGYAPRYLMIVLTSLQ